MDWSLPGCPWDFSSTNTGMGCHALLQGIFQTQGSNPSLLHLLHCRRILYHWGTGEAHILILYIFKNQLIYNPVTKISRTHMLCSSSFHFPACPLRITVGIILSFSYSYGLVFLVLEFCIELTLYMKVISVTLTFIYRNYFCLFLKSATLFLIIPCLLHMFLFPSLSKCFQISFHIIYCK